MEKAILLEAEGFEVLFEVSEEKENCFPIEITLTFQTESNQGKFHSRHNFIDRKDLLRLAGYFENHIGNVMVDPSHESRPFVTQDLDFQITAFQGEIWDDLGAFSISFMLNVGFDKTRRRLYAGCQSEIMQQKARNFIDSIKKLVA